MNGLALRISNAGAKKTKNACAFSKLDVSNYFSQDFVTSNEPFSAFFNAATADEQLSALKPILEQEASVHETNGECNIHTVQFLVKIFFYAEAKHPVKCFLARFITKNKFIQPQFSSILSVEIKTAILNETSTYRDYIDVLTNISSCIENFPSGSVAVKNLEVELGKYLDSCLRCCVETLRSSQTLPPTEKNEIYNLAHLALRIFLYIVQKISPENGDQMTSAFTTVRTSIHSLLFDEDAPMDTKSVCGMLYLNMLLLEKGQDSWVHILHSNTQDPEMTSLLTHEASQLALYSAIATVISADELQSQTVEGEAAIIVLCKKILDIGDRSCSESIFILGVTRTLLQISKQLEKCTDSSLGRALVANLLNFVWAHLEHYMDSVRHLTAQVLRNIVKYCSRLEEEDPLSSLFEALKTCLDVGRKSYYVSLTALTCEVGAKGVLTHRPKAVCDALRALSVQHTQASATTLLETLLIRHSKEADTETIYEAWVEPILEHVHSSNLHSSVLGVLQSLLTKVVQMDPQMYYYILPLMKNATTNSDLKCVLILLSVTRKSGVTSKVEDDGREWKGLISYSVLERAAIDAVEETRILCLSLIAESPKTTEVFTHGELNFILTFIKYNINAQSPNFRQLMLSMLKKFIKRLEDSYKVYKKQYAKDGDYYIEFYEELRGLCFDSLIHGANYSRRLVALQTLVWCEHLHLDGYDKMWIEEYVDKLLLHLEDGYENNKAFALEILSKCPSSLITCKKYSISIELEDILRQASSLKPTECVSAAYKLDLLIAKIPEKILAGNTCNSSIPSKVMFVLLQKLQNALLGELERCSSSVVNACSDAPMYGVLHCMVHLVSRLDADAISSSSEWSDLIGEIITTCVRVNAAVACVVNSASPEGHLPCDMGPATSSEVRLQDGRQVTAQMVLLCAWRSVKEVSLLLGEISSRLTIAGESPVGTLTAEQMVSMGEHFTKLLAETKHRGAFEQAYVGFTKLLARLWRCRSGRLPGLPGRWLHELMAGVEGGGGGGLCTTRRGAGLPFMIQALVTTELQVQGNPKCFHKCMATLFRLARTSPAEEHQSETAIETRTHSINILRALFRNSALDESVSSYVGEGLIVSLDGFEGRTWMERNSSTLLFSALMVRVFGVQRGKDSDRLSVRNRMTGRIFFLRYPALYDYMMNKLKEVSSSDAGNLRPALYPVLLLLARLYPSSLEGTVSNLKLAAYVPLVSVCAWSRALHARQLAARALPSLIAPERYIVHLEAMLNLICDKNIPKNYCHGILLQLARLIDVKPKTPDEELRPDMLHYHLYNNISEEETAGRVAGAIRRSYWVLEQALGDRPCYLLATEYINIINHIVWRFPNLINKDMSEYIQWQLEKLIFNENPSPITSGKEICLSHALYLYYIMSNKYGVQKTCDLMFRSLSHVSYEVVLTTLNFMLILYESLEIENKFEEHLDEIFNNGPREMSKSSEVIETLNEFVQILCQILKTVKYLECQQKTLKVLSLIKNTERYIVQTKMKKKGVKITNEITVNTLIEHINCEHENIVHVYLECLSNFVSKIVEESAVKPILMLNVLRVMLDCARACNTSESRAAVVRFLEHNHEEIFMMSLDGLSKQAKFEFKATVYATLVILLEDDDSSLRQRISNIVMKQQDAPNNNYDGISNVSSQDEAFTVVPSRAAEVLRELIASHEENKVAVLTVLALMDFKSEVCMNDGVDDECRVFDQSERYNIYLEETVWTKEIAEKIKQIVNQAQLNVLDLIVNVIHHHNYKNTMVKLCNDNLVQFHNVLNGALDVNTPVNPKVEMFIHILRN